MSETAASGDQAGTIRVSVKELLGTIERKIDDLADQVRHSNDAHERRLAILEARIPIDDDIRQRFVGSERDFAGFERRFSLHERDAAHLTLPAEVALLKADVQALKDGATAANAVQALLRQMSDQRRWLIGLSASSVLSILGLAVALVRLNGGHL